MSERSERIIDELLFAHGCTRKHPDAIEIEGCTHE